MSSTPLKSCSQKLCTVDTDGACLEGLEVNACPHYKSNNEVDTESEVIAESNENEVISLIEPTVTPDQVEIEASIEEETNIIVLHNGKHLTLSDASEIMASSEVRVVVVAGATNSGKTTMLTSLYEKFLEGPFSGFSFASCKTLAGYEERCHHSRISSERATPTTARTRYSDDVQLLHLEVKSLNSPNDRWNVLFTDIAGERFESASKRQDDCERLDIISRADHFVLLIDCERLIHPEKRQEAVSMPERLMTRCLQGEMLGSNSLVDIVFTKIDLIMALNEVETLNNVVKSQKERFASKFESQVKRLRFVDVAARPEQGSTIEFGFGLENLLTEWIYNRPIRSYLDVQLGALITDDFRSFALKTAKVNFEEL